MGLGHKSIGLLVILVSYMMSLVVMVEAIPDPDVRKIPMPYCLKKCMPICMKIRYADVPSCNKGCTLGCEQLQGKGSLVV
ncbi:unnamed protein product [Lupinus luteus]|uniref:Uncharacterized protein n=1 Tax=Lupinus luteus TaxID=3873 RepID=A0AAV1WBV0_LUPLU